MGPGEKPVLREVQPMELSGWSRAENGPHKLCGPGMRGSGLWCGSQHRESSQRAGNAGRGSRQGLLISCVATLPNLQKVKSFASSI